LAVEIGRIVNSDRSRVTTFTFLRWTQPEAPAVSVPAHLSESVALVVDAAARLLAVILSPRQFCWLEGYAGHALARPTSSEAKHVLSLVELFERLATPESDTGAWCRESQSSVLRSLSGKEDELSRTLTQWFFDATRVLAPGFPPLTQEVADSFFELQLLATCLTRSHAWTADFEQNRAGMLAALIERYPDYSADQQCAIAEMPTTLYDARRSWAGLSGYEREQLGGHLARVFGLATSDSPLTPRVTPREASGVRPASPARLGWARCLSQSLVGEPQRSARRG